MQINAGSPFILKIQVFSLNQALKLQRIALSLSITKSHNKSVRLIGRCFLECYVVVCESSEIYSLIVNQKYFS